jgi:hypothetical protein
VSRFAQKTVQTGPQNGQNQERDCPKDARHDVMRNHMIEVPIPMPGERRNERNEKNRQGHGERQDHRHDPSVPAKRASERRRVAQFLIRLQTDLSESLGNIYAEFVRRSVLACVEALAAVMAEVGQIVEIGVCETQTAFHSGEHGAKPFAVAAGIADGHDAFALAAGEPSNFA